MKVIRKNDGSIECEYEVNITDLKHGSAVSRWMKEWSDRIAKNDPTYKSKVRKRKIDNLLKDDEK